MVFSIGSPTVVGDSTYLCPGLYAQYAGNTFVHIMVLCSEQLNDKQFNLQMLQKTNVSAKAIGLSATTACIMHHFCVSWNIIHPFVQNDFECFSYPH